MDASEAQWHGSTVEIELSLLLVWIHFRSAESACWAVNSTESLGGNLDEGIGKATLVFVMLLLQQAGLV